MKPRHTGWLSVCAAIVSAALLVGCSNSTEIFCDEFATKSDLNAVVKALRDDDLKGATAEAKKLSELASRAPDAVRTDMKELAGAVLDIIELLQRDKDQASVSKGPATSTAEVEQLRDQLNQRFDDLDERSTRVSRWASEECGINL